MIPLLFVISTHKTILFPFVRRAFRSSFPSCCPSLGIRLFSGLRCFVGIFRIRYARPIVSTAPGHICTDETRPTIHTFLIRKYNTVATELYGTLFLSFARPA